MALRPDVKLAEDHVARLPFRCASHRDEFFRIAGLFRTSVEQFNVIDFEDNAIKLR